MRLLQAACTAAWVPAPDHEWALIEHGVGGECFSKKTLRELADHLASGRAFRGDALAEEPLQTENRALTGAGRIVYAGSSGPTTSPPGPRWTGQGSEARAAVADRCCSGSGEEAS